MTVRGKPEILPGPNRQRNIARGETAYDFLKNAFLEIQKKCQLGFLVKHKFRIWSRQLFALSTLASKFESSSQNLF